jgi:hypothetical protein
MAGRKTPGDEPATDAQPQEAGDVQQDVVVDEPQPETVDLVHDETGGRQTVANDRAVLATQEARGWRVATAEDDAVDPDAAPARIGVPDVGVATAEDDAVDPDAAPARIGVPDVDERGDEWVTLVHDDLPTGTNRVANTPAALAAAAEAGWHPPLDDEQRELAAQAAADEGLEPAPVVVEPEPVAEPAPAPQDPGAPGAGQQDDTAAPAAVRNPEPVPGTKEG